METDFIYELIGYIASVLVAISLMMSKIVRLRIINMLGAITFIIYGIFINSIPVAGVNAFIVLVNIYYLAKIYTSEEYFKLLQVSPDDEYLIHFLDFYKDEISVFQPGFSFNSDQHKLILMVLRDMMPAGIFVGKKDVNNPKILNAELDFVIPQYRDFKIGRFLFYDKQDFFTDQGISVIRARPEHEKHRKYLEQMGFQPDEEGDEWYYYLITESRKVIP